MGDTGPANFSIQLVQLPSVLPLPINYAALKEEDDW